MMAAATVEVRALALEAAARHLREAATFAALHATSKPLFRKTMRVGGVVVEVRFEWPGVLRGFDSKTGELLYQSLPGSPGVLAVPGR